MGLRASAPGRGALDTDFKGSGALQVRQVLPTPHSMATDPRTRRTAQPQADLSSASVTG
jgi:hypothetical protein